MRIKGLNYEDFLQYKKPAMFIICPFCDFKCDIENGNQICQNWSLAKADILELSDDIIIKNYLNNPITKAIIFGGLEPLYNSFGEVIQFIDKLRNEYGCFDDVVIYTGYNKEEVEEKVIQLQQYKNIIVKFGRYLPDQENHYDDILGINLASNNQYAEKIS